MATPETRCAELDLVVESEQNQVMAPDTRELSAYSFDSDHKTLVGIGTSGFADSADFSESTDSISVRHFDSSDLTLVGIGPAERERRARLELGSDLREGEATPESVPLPYSEAPGPFVACDDDDVAPPRLPMKQRQPWLLALSAVLIAAAAVALVRGGVPYGIATRVHSASAAPLPAPNEPQARATPFETAVASSTESSAVEPAIAAAVAPAVATSIATSGTQAPEAPQVAAPSATVQRETQRELAPRPASSAKSAGSELLGALDVTSNPPAGLVLDGRPLGKAPRVIQLPAGPHTVLFVHPQRGRVSVTVNVRPGRTTIASADF